MPIDEHDLRQLRRALELAHTAIGRSDPNPRVGCVLADARGRSVGEGTTQRAGEAHAEVVALRAARQAGASLTGGCAWVSLEPCSYHGRTPPCCEALIAAQLARVVVAAIDPNPLVSGAGARLNAALIAADLVDEFLVYLAPRLIGPGRGIADLPPLAQLSQARALRFVSATSCGDDVRLIARPPERERTLD
jgi:diaminohydroxyphosphoribosylaminopyrimidine deaminase/5-amino-6-(5-phosphoribosylamino)uracil reductase